MGRVRRQRALFRKSLKSMEKYHDEVVDKIYRNPVLLDELGFDSTKIIFSEKNPLPLVKGGRRIDLLFLYDFGNHYQLLLIEEAIGVRHSKDQIDQLRHAQLDFKHRWKEWFKRRKGKLALSDKEVFLRTIFLNWDPVLTSLKEAIDITHSEKRTRLGKLILSKL